MVGVWDPFGIALCLLLAGGGLLVGMWGSPVGPPRLTYSGGIQPWMSSSW